MSFDPLKNPGISPSANIFARASVCERAPSDSAHKCEPERMLRIRREINVMGHQRKKDTRLSVLFALVTHPGIEPEFPA